MARNHPFATLGAFGCAVLAVFLGAVAAYGLHEGSIGERRVVQLGLVVLGPSLVLGVYAGVETWGDRTEPSITVTPRSGSVVTVSVSGTGLRSSDHLIVEVEQLLRVARRARRARLEDGAAALRRLARAERRRGDLAHRQPQLPAGDFDDLGARAWVGDEPKPCYGQRQHDRLRARPHPAAAGAAAALRQPGRPSSGPRGCWCGSRRATSAQRPALSMTLRVYGIAAGAAAAPPRRVVARPRRRRHVRPPPAIVVGHAFSDVCVVASISSRDPACPAARPRTARSGRGSRSRPPSSGSGRPREGPAGARALRSACARTRSENVASAAAASHTRPRRRRAGSRLRWP